MSKFPPPPLSADQKAKVVHGFLILLRSRDAATQRAISVVRDMLVRPEGIDAVPMSRAAKVDLTVDALQMQLMQTRDADKQAAIQSVLEMLETRVDIVIDAEAVAQGRAKW